MVLNEWWDDARTREAEAEAIDAARDQRAARYASAAWRYGRAWHLYAAVAAEVPAGFPNTRADLEGAAVACRDRAGPLVWGPPS